MDQALADPAWVRERLREAASGTPRRTVDWGQEALSRANIHFRWLVCPDKQSALDLERQCQRLLADAGLWNRRI